MSCILNISTGGKRLGFEVTTQYSKDRGITSNWGIIGQAIWFITDTQINGVNDVVYSGMDFILNKINN